MKNKKIIFIVTILLVGLSITGITLAASRLTSVYFTKGKEIEVTGDYGTEINPSVRASQLIGTPVINVKCQKKVLFGFSGGANMDLTISEVEKTYYAAFDAESAGTFKITWKQTNDNASMLATIDVQSNNIG